MAENAVKETKNSSPKKEKKANKGSVLKFFRDLKGEFKKIVWPSKKQVINNTVIVIAAVVVIGLCISLIDLGLSFLVKLFLGTL